MSDQIVTPSARAAPSIPDYELLRPIGRGAYGEVWLARNVTGSWVALKVVHRSAFDHDRPFEREFEGIKRFEPISRSDPSQVAILHVGLGDGFFYYVMELADAVEMQNEECKMKNEAAANPTARDCQQSILNFEFYTLNYHPKTLKRLLNDRGALPAGECLAIALSLTRALAHLHGHGLVHRDVKPSNVIFVNGQAKLADIGLVTSVDATRSFVGTEGYLPAEGAGTPQADLYSLGKVLYEMSTGCDRKEFPALPPDIATRPDRDTLAELNAIVVRACQLNPRERYARAEAMQADLEHLQRGRSIRRHHAWRNRLTTLRKTGAFATVTIIALAGLLFFGQTTMRQDPRSVPPINEDGSAGARNPKAAEAYRLGLSAMRRGTTEGFRQAREDFIAAIDADAKFVAAHARLFEIYLMSEDHGLAIIDGKTEQLNKLSAKLVELDPTNAETHAALGIVRLVNDWKWAESESEFKQALSVDTKCRMALVYYGYFLTRLRRADEARTLLERALKLDPASPLITKFLGHCQFVERRYEQALPFYLHASELEPSYPSGHYWAGRVCLALTNYSQALDEFEHHELNQGLRRPETEQRYLNLHEALEKGGPRGYWARRNERAKDDGSWASTPYRYAERYARLGDKPQALVWLEKALAQRDSMENLLADEFWDDFREEPKFKEILKAVGLGSGGR